MACFLRESHISLEGSSYSTHQRSPGASFLPWRSDCCPYSILSASSSFEECFHRCHRQSPMTILDCGLHRPRALIHSRWRMISSPPHRRLRLMTRLLTFALGFFVAASAEQKRNGVKVLLIVFSFSKIFLMIYDNAIEIKFNVSRFYWCLRVLLQWISRCWMSLRLTHFVDCRDNR